MGHDISTHPIFTRKPPETEVFRQSHMHERKYMQERGRRNSVTKREKDRKHEKREDHATSRRPSTEKQDGMREAQSFGGNQPKRSELAQVHKTRD